MNVIHKFNGLHGATVSRNEISSLIALAKENEQFQVVEQLEPLLKYDDQEFIFDIKNPSYEVVPQSLLHGIDYEESQDDANGLGKPVSPTEVYQIITDKVIEMIKKANTKDFKKAWNAKEYGTGYTIPFNFSSKKRYRGVNVLMLTGLEPMENPFFLTFKQVSDLKGKVKKGAKGYEVVYFTKIFKTEDKAKDLRFSSYDKNKVETFKTENGIENDLGVIPMLKYYHVYNGADIEGIDFKLDQFKHGFIDQPKPAEEANRMEIPEAIIKNYPKPQPILKFGGDKAFHRGGGVGLVQMPYLSDFDTVQDYYRTLFHEYSHSTGSPQRLNRKLGTKFGSKDYAFEELVAELGAIFLSAEAGIIWHSNKNHAAYLKSWNNVLSQIKDDNKFIMKASTAAQKIADFILQFDKNGDPLYFKDIKIEPVVKKQAKKIEIKKKIISKTELEKANPKPHAIKPKSVSVATAIKDILETGKYKNIKPLQASVFFNVFKDLPENQETFEVNDKFKIALLEKISDQYAYVSEGEWFGDRSGYYNLVVEPTDKGFEFINSVKNRLESLRNQKHNFALFDGLKAPKKPLKKAKPLNGLKETIITSVAASVTASVVANSLKRPAKKAVKKPIVKGLKNPAPGEIINTNSLAYRMQNKGKTKHEYYIIPNREISGFLGNIEKKQKESVAITIAGGQGSMKTRLCFQLMDAFAQNYKVGHASIEEHPESALYEDKIEQYISNKALKNIESPEINTIEDVHTLVKNNDVIIIDSFSKLQEMQRGCELDKDFRKAYDGKLFIIIYQLTGDGKMRGGSKSQFDGDIICDIAKQPDYRDNYVCANKNRYQSKNLEDLKFNIFSGALIPTEVTIENQPAEKFNFSFNIE